MSTHLVSCSKRRDWHDGILVCLHCLGAKQLYCISMVAHASAYQCINDMSKHYAMQVAQWMCSL